LELSKDLILQGNSRRKEKIIDEIKGNTVKNSRSLENLKELTESQY
jgi:hypothetical protein